METKKTSVLHLYPGPIYDAKAVHFDKYEALSNYFEGEVVSTSNETVNFEIGSFKVNLFRPKPRNSLTLFICLLLETFKAARRIRTNRELDILVCYDPLKTGLIGVILKPFFNYALVIEINGVYDSQKLYEHLGLFGKFKKSLYLFLQKYIMSRADALKTLYSGQIDNFRIPKDIPIHSYFDHTAIDAVEESGESRNRVLSIGFPFYIKGIDILVSAFRKIRVSAPDWELHILGFFTEDEKIEIKRLSDNCDRVVVHDAVPFSEIKKYIDECEIFALASRSEGMGRVLIEAAARSKARIASDVDGIPTVVHHEKDGLLFNSQDVDALAGGLLRLIKNPDERRHFGQQAHIRFKKEFTIEIYIENTRSLYIDAINTQKAKTYE